MRAARRGPALWAALALIVSAACVGWQYRQALDPHYPNDRFHLEGFDAFVYVAMADHPEFFTIAPWGYRWLAPRLVHASAGHRVERGFRRVTLGALTVCGLLLFAWLRRLGAPAPYALVATAVFALSRPVAELSFHRYLSDPLSLLLLLATLLALESGAGLGVLALLLALGALSKELAFLAVPAVFLGLWSRARGAGRAPLKAAVLGTLLATLPALAVTWWLRGWWAPHVSEPGAPMRASDLPAALELLAQNAWYWWRPVLMAGALPLGLVGALRPESRALLLRYGYLAAATLALPFGAGFYAGPEQLAFFSGDVPRLLLYALPFWLALAISALRPLHPAALEASGDLARWASRAAGALAAMLALALPFELDTYRRVDLSGPRDGPLVLALSGETLRTATRLDRGETVSFTPERQRFAPGHVEPTQLTRMRWFLRDGWGERAHHGIHDIRMRAAQATILLPVFTPRDVDVVLDLRSRARLELSLFAGGRPLGRAAVPAGVSRQTFRVPASALFRGDNELTLAVQGDAPWLVVERLAYRPAF